RVHAQDHLGDVLRVALALDDRSGAAVLGAGDGAVPGVDLVGVAVEDGVDLGAGLLDDAPEDLAGLDLLLEGGGVLVEAGALVVSGHDDVGLAVGLVTVGQLLRDAVDRLGRATELQHGAATRADQRGRLPA